MIIVDRLSLRSLIYLLPHLVRQKVARHAPVDLRYFDATSKGSRFAKVYDRLGWTSTQVADYSYVDVLDESGALDLERTLYLGSLPLCNQVRSDLWESDSLVSRFGRRFDRKRILLYLEKTVSEEVTRVLMRVHVVAWFHRKRPAGDAQPSTFILAKGPWFRYIQEYASAQGVQARGYSGLSFSTGIPWPWNKSLLGSCRRFAGLLAPVTWKMLMSALRKRTRAKGVPVSAAAPNKGELPPFTVAVPYTGKGMTRDLSMNSDLFWAPFANLRPNQLLVYWVRPDDLMDQSQYMDLRESSIQAVAFRVAAKAGTPIETWPRSRDLPLLVRTLRRDWRFLLSPLLGSILSRGTKRRTASYLLKFMFQYAHWRWFFDCFNVRVQVDYGDEYRPRLASDMAIADREGLSITYQRTFEDFASMFRASAVDVHFSFSSAWLETERISRSPIPQFVSGGYIHDHAFDLVGERAMRVRNNLFDQGAKFIVCFLDENSTEDPRWGLSHTHAAENYRYLLNRLLADPTLGLIFKPKKPANLRRRLGPLSELLDQALATGRCHLYSEGIIATPVLPIEASRAADVTIGQIYGSTAAFECSLAGSRVLLLDRESVLYHSLYQLGEGRVVFKDWDSLWESLNNYRENPDSVDGFGDWSSVLPILDEFRDGKTAQRIGEYVSWLVDALDEGLSREQAMELAQRRYTDAWGADKIVDLLVDSESVIADSGVARSPAREPSVRR